MSVRLAAVLRKLSEHSSIDTDLTGKLIVPVDIAACVPSDIQATRFKLTRAPTKAP